MSKFVMDLWTSKLIIKHDLDNDELDVHVTEVVDTMESLFSVFNPNSVVSKINRGECTYESLIEFISNDDLIKRFHLPENIKEFARYNGKTYDFTGVMKGMFNDKIHEVLCHKGSKSHLISFGGDILGYNVDAEIPVDKSNLTIHRSGNFCICTSGNNEVRNDHIQIKHESAKFYRSVTVVHQGCNCTRCDMRSTDIYASGNTFDRFPREEVYFVDRDERFYVPNTQTYIASPFFNEKEIRIRNKMAKAFRHVFRPDLTENSSKYNVSPGAALARLIYEDNIREIKSAAYLVFPRYTNDLGTMFEVGVALKLNHSVIRYDYKTDTYDVLDRNNKSLQDFVVTNNDIIDCSTVAGAIVVGYNFENSNLKYSIGELNDNIMLSANYTRYELVDDKYIQMQTKQSEIR